MAAAATAVGGMPREALGPSRVVFCAFEASLASTCSSSTLRSSPTSLSTWRVSFVAYRALSLEKITAAEEKHYFDEELPPTRSVPVLEGFRVCRLR